VLSTDPPPGERLAATYWGGVFQDFHALWARRVGGPGYSRDEKQAWAELLAVLQFEAGLAGYFAQSGRRPPL
jgi:hypothetical protein